MQIDTDQLVKEMNAEALRIKQVFGYNDVYFNGVRITDSGYVRIDFLLEDDFQAKIPWDKKVQHGVESFDYPISTAGLYSREERELRVLLAQQGESTALANELISAAGRRFVQSLQEERAKYAQLVDFRNEKATF